MKSVQTKKHPVGFELLLVSKLGQAAMMTQPPSAASDDEISNEHPASEQWLYVVAGRGSATIAPKRGHRRTIKLVPGTLLLIEAGELHQIRNTGSQPLHTLNMYLPPRLPR